MSPVLALYDDLIKVLLTKFMTKLYDNLKFSYNNESNQNLNKPESCTNKWLNLIPISPRKENLNLLEWIKFLNLFSYI